ncbi:MAG: hypothetical protein M3R68_06470 [Acidobacteriota bacterium]|nr:hypothetical protein [Acidobacteriota bacterium]
MKREWKLWAGIFGTVVLLTGAISIFGQQKPVEGSIIIQRERIVQGPDGPQGPPPPPDVFYFIASEMNFDGKLVKGAPYSAQAVTETTQLLGDGNRIVNKSTASIYRDSEGRTRREHTLSMLGQFANAGDAPQTIAINDPVAGINYALDPRAKIAHKMSPMHFQFKIASPGGDGERVPGPPDGPVPGVMAPPPPERGEMRVGPPPASPAGPEHMEVHPDVFIRHAPAPAPGSEGIVMEWHGSREQNAKTESLGKQTIEGVEAEGTRTTMTIPVGEIGNERAIEVVSERWFSPELQVVVMTKHSDPRMGETTYRLTSISRSEPAKSLFEVPADYTIKEAPAAGQQIQRMRMRKPGTEE